MGVVLEGTPYPQQSTGLPEQENRPSWALPSDKVQLSRSNCLWMWKDSSSACGLAGPLKAGVSAPLASLPHPGLGLKGRGTQVQRAMRTACFRSQ